MKDSLEANLELLAMVPESIWLTFTQRCEEGPAYLPITPAMYFKKEGRVLNLFLERTEQSPQLGMVFMEPLSATSTEEINRAIQDGTLDPKVLQAPPFMTGKNSVLVYGDWFKDLKPLHAINWRVIGSSIQLVLGDHQKLLTAPPKEDDWERIKDNKA